MSLNLGNLKNELKKYGYLYADNDAKKLLDDLRSIQQGKRKKVIYHCLYIEAKILEIVFGEFGFNVKAISFIEDGVKDIAYQVTATV